MGIITTNPFNNYSIKKEKGVHKFLTEEEVKIIEDCKFTEDEGVLKLIRDVFILCCYTGLSYSDVKDLSQNDIITDINYGLCISKERIKTGVKIYTPLLDKPRIILEKYKNNPNITAYNKIIPVPHIRGYNYYLDIIVKKCGITKKVTSHVARHTAATFFLNNGIPEEIVCKAIGLASVDVLRSTYGKLHDNTVNKHFAILNESIKKTGSL